MQYKSACVGFINMIKCAYYIVLNASNLRRMAWEKLPKSMITPQMLSESFTYLPFIFRISFCFITIKHYIVKTIHKSEIIYVVLMLWWNGPTYFHLEFPQIPSHHIYGNDLQKLQTASTGTGRIVKLVEPTLWQYTVNKYIANAMVSPTGWNFLLH